MYRCMHWYTAAPRSEACSGPGPITANRGLSMPFCISEQVEYTLQTASGSLVRGSTVPADAVLDKTTLFVADVRKFGQLAVEVACLFYGSLGQPDAEQKGQKQTATEDAYGVTDTVAGQRLLAEWFAHLLQLQVRLSLKGMDSRR